jgi:hypothetical protein
MKKTLSEYIKIGSEAEIPDFPIANHELRSLFDKLETASKPTLTHKLITHKGKIIMGIIGISILAFFVSNFSPYLSDNSVITENNKFPTNIESVDVSKENRNENAIKINNENKDELSLDIENQDKANKTLVTVNQALETQSDTLKTINRVLSAHSDILKTINRQLAANADSLKTLIRTIDPKNIHRIKADGSNYSINKIPGLEKLELTREEMAKIGLKIFQGYSIDDDSLVNHSDTSNLSDKIRIRNALNRLEKNIITESLMPNSIYYFIYYFSQSKYQVVNDGQSSHFYHRKKHNNTQNANNPKIIINNVNEKNLDKLINSNTPHIILPDSTNSSKPITIEIENYADPSKEIFLSVHFIIGDNNPKDSTKTQYCEINAWYLVNKEFAELLPDRYRIPILRELQIKDSIDKGIITSDEACTTLKGISYLDLCRQNGAGIEAAEIYPNPVTDGQFELKFTLKESSKMKFDVYSVSGDLLKSLKDFTNYRSGINAEKFNIQGLAQGVFLIAITNDKGEQIIRKFMIK